MKLYRYLTGPDDAKVCHRITAALNDGWALHGGPTLTYDAERRQVIAGQAIVREKPGDYRPDLDLSSQ